jgi:biotin operon repressor
MPYERSQALEKRLQQLLGLLRRGRQSAESLAAALEISQPTVSRCLAALRKRGHSIKAVKDERGWAYRLGSSDGGSSRNAKGVS